MEFYVPQNLVQDYKDFLKTDVCHEIRYCRDILDENPVWKKERVEISSINYKSKQYGSDNSIRMTTAYDSDIQKGDALIYDGRMYIVTWQTHHDSPNAKITTIEMANIPLIFYRWGKEIADSKTGKIIQRGGYKVICPEIRCIATNNGSYEYRIRDTQAGVEPNNRTTISLQANPATMNIDIGDVYSFCGKTFVIKDILYNELNYNADSGLLVLHSEKIILSEDLP